MKRTRIYTDTSVIGGCFDVEFRVDSLRLWSEFQNATKTLVYSDLVAAELEKGPVELRNLIRNLPVAGIEKVALDEESAELADAYLKAGIVAARSVSDARHIAIASVANVDALVSWNFKHIVNLNRIREYHAVNVRLGYPLVEIRTPKEVIEDES